jgi:hypothetical protein
MTAVDSVNFVLAAQEALVHGIGVVNKGSDLVSSKERSDMVSIDLEVR